MFSIGTVSSAVNMKKLNVKWQQKKDNSDFKAKTYLEKQIEEIKSQAADVRDGNQLSEIDAKLKSGAELSSSEMEYLKKESPELYQEALKIKAERAQYKRELNACQTKEDVERLNASKMQSFFSEAKAVRNNPNITKDKKLELLEKINR